MQTSGHLESDGKQIMKDQLLLENVLLDKQDRSQMFDKDNKSSSSVNALQELYFLPSAFWSLSILK